MQRSEERSLVQRRLWGRDPRAWAELAEAHNRPLFEAVLDAAGVTRGTRLLDVGCGSGLALQLGRERGASVSGLDISRGLLEIARERLPEADLREGDMESLPFADDEFDAVIGVNAFQFAGDPVGASRGRAGHARHRGGEPLRRARALAGTALHEALQALVPPERARPRPVRAVRGPRRDAARSGPPTRPARRGRVRLALPRRGGGGARPSVLGRRRAGGRR